MSSRAAVFAVLLAAGAACTEEITVPGVCPDFCPPGSLTSVDTVLADAVQGDSAFRGYVTAHDASVMLVADLPSVQARAVFRTSALPATLSIGGDTAARVGVDSMQLRLTITRRDTSARRLTVAFYRLPLQLDSTTTFAALAPAFAAPPIRTVNVDSLIALVTDTDTATKPTVDSARVVGGVVSLFVMFDSAQVGYTADDSAQLAIGVGASVDPTASGQASLALAAEDAGPLLLWYATVDSQGTRMRRDTLRADAPFDSYVIDPPPAAPDSSLAVGGAPSSRSILRLSLPQALVDSTQVVRATLVLVPVAAAPGSPADSFPLVAQRVAADLGGKSPLGGPTFTGDNSFSGSTFVHAGSLDTVRIEITDMVKRWQIDTTLSTALLLWASPEGATLGEIRFASSRIAASRPVLHVTFMPGFPFGVP